MPVEIRYASTQFTLTAAARALLHPGITSEWLSKFAVQLSVTCQLRDLVRIPPCRVTFQVASKIWTISEAGEELLIVLDLAPGEPILSVV